MRTPAGKECPYFYGNYFRGRHQEECRLLVSANPPQKWKPNLCETCPVPSITLANSCENMILSAQVTRPLLAAFQLRVEIRAYCRKTEQAVKEPHIGCGQCHAFPTVFEVKE